MNSNVTQSIVQIEKKNLKQLLTEVKETVATNVEHKTFNATDLWSIQKTTKRALRNKLTDRWKM
jgi:hypothetical protein